jgi:hypothetical protein
MSRRRSFAKLFATALFAFGLSVAGTGCLADTGSLERGLDDNPVPGVERCALTAGDWTAPGQTPPPISIPIGDRELPADQVLTSPDFEGAPRDLLTEYTTAHINIEMGVDLDAEHIDLLMAAEDILTGAAERDDSVTVALIEMNQRWAEEYACVNKDITSATAETPYMNPQRPDGFHRGSRNPLSAAREQGQLMKQ